MLLDGWVLPQAIIREVDAMANRLGRGAFPHNGHLHLYSGPSRSVWNLIAGDQERNTPRAVVWAKDHGAIIIDDCPVGLYLSHFQGRGMRNYFQRNPRVRGKDDKKAAARLPWKYASQLLVLSAYGHVTTTVCGAGRDAVYYTIEMPNTLVPVYHGLSATEFLSALSTPRREEVEAVNLIPFTKVHDVYKTKGVEPAHMMIQLGEIRMALHEALKKSSPDAIREALKTASKEVLRSPADAYKYFLESQERFAVDYALQMKGTPAGDRFLATKTPKARQGRREERLDTFTTKVVQLIETEIALMPPGSKRPSFIVPAYVKTRSPR